MIDRFGDALFECCNEAPSGSFCHLSYIAKEFNAVYLHDYSNIFLMPETIHLNPNEGSLQDVSKTTAVGRKGKNNSNKVR